MALVPGGEYGLATFLEDEGARQGTDLRDYREYYLADDIRRTRDGNQWLREEIDVCRREAERVCAVPALMPPTSYSAGPVRRKREVPSAPREVPSARAGVDFVRRRGRGVPAALGSAALDVPAVAAARLPARVAVGDTAQLEVVYSSEVLGRALPPPDLRASWYAGSAAPQVEDSDVMVRGDGLRCVVPEGCADKHLKVMLETRAGPGFPFAVSHVVATPRPVEVALVALAAAPSASPAPPSSSKPSFGVPLGSFSFVGISEEGRRLCVKGGGVTEWKWFRAPGTAAAGDVSDVWPAACASTAPWHVPTADDVGCRLVAVCPGAAAVWSPVVAPRSPELTAAPRLEVVGGGKARVGSRLVCVAAYAGGDARGTCSVTWSRLPATDQDSSGVTVLPSGSELELAANDVGSCIRCCVVPVRKSDGASGPAYWCSLPGVVEGAVACAPRIVRQAEALVVEGEGDVVWWSRLAGGAHGDPEEEGDGPVLPIADRLRGRAVWATIRTPAAPFVRSATMLVSPAGPHQASIDIVHRPQHWLPGLQVPSGAAVEWEWSGDGEEWEGCGRASIFQQGPDDVAGWMRAVDGGVEVGRVLVGFTPWHAAELRRRLLGGASAFRAKVAPQAAGAASTVVMLGSRSVKLLDDGEVMHRSAWDATVRVNPTGDTTARFRLADGTSYNAEFGSGADLELFVCCWRLFAALGALNADLLAAGGASLVDEDVRAAWRKGRCHGKDAASAAAASLRTALDGGSATRGLCLAVAAQSQSTKHGAACARTLAALLLAGADGSVFR
eukprot:TRINITY_DN18150_c0_g1_i2.p1 TRINITY_DN18150_c0_g1~~TRINITY_DN18150_c0_g1_i2.p1  ORF type:complete len:786 (+),score=163.53 TRINITY_DN18150_c0_g1_i2:61-2418(+)